MNLKDHIKKAEEIKKSLDKLLPDESGKNVVAIVELSYGIAIHLIAAGMEKKYGKHLDTHVGLIKNLRNLGESRIAELFHTLDSFRVGRWYGGKGNGEVVKRCLDILKELEKWSEK